MFHNILVVIDPSTDQQKALKRAIELASKINKTTPDKPALVTAFFSIFDFSYEMTTMLSSDERDTMREMVIKEKQAWVDELIKSINSPVAITSKVVWHNRPFEAIIEEVIHYSYDLVIKGTHQHDKFKSVIFTPTDWHILRKCPCPVLLVKDHKWPEQGNVLAAVNVGGDEEAHLSLNKAITSHTKSIAALICANVHLVNSYPGTPVNIAIEIPEFDASEYTNAMLTHHQSAMADHANDFSIPLINTHVKEGLPESVIESVAKNIDAELVVMGTVGRTGIPAALIGNTAEHVLDQLSCDVLALKPSGFVSPLAE
jgi:universal stress protein E